MAFAHAISAACVPVAVDQAHIVPLGEIVHQTVVPVAHSLVLSW